jgi:hypothetical protein
MSLPGKTNQGSSRKPTASSAAAYLRGAGSAVSSSKKVPTSASERAGLPSTKAGRGTDLPDVSNLQVRSAATTMKRKQSVGGNSGNENEDGSKASNGASENPPGWPGKRVRHR